MDVRQAAVAIDRLDRLLFKANRIETELHELAVDLLAAQREIAFLTREDTNVGN